MADQEFLASFAVEIDEGGVSRLQEILSQNRELAEGLAEAFSAATEAIQALREEMGTLPSFSSGGMVTEGMSGMGALTLGLNTAEARQEMESIIALAKKPVSLSANASGIVSAARSAYENVRSLFSSPLILRARVQAEGEGSADGSGSAGETVKMSAGGRFARPTDVQVAEDGDAEYIIPVKKEDRAVPLLRQLLAELSPGARQSLGNSEILRSLLPKDQGPFDSCGMASVTQIKDLDRCSTIQNSELNGGMSAGTAITPQITQTNQNVSAPVSIEVHASGANAERIGESVYNTAERYLLRTMRGVFG